MIFIDKMKNLKIYRVQTYLPTKKDDKKKHSAILLLTPNYESSKRLMNSDLFINNRRYLSYYLEKSVAYYLNTNEIEEVEESVLIEDQLELISYNESTKRSELPDSAFGIPSKRKFPLDTEKHVRSAIRFFNYTDEEDEAGLANNIIKAMKKFDIYGKVSVSKRNRFSKYYKVAISENVLSDYKINSEVFNNIDESLITDDFAIIFNEANVQDTQLKKLLYKSRIRYRKELLILLDQVKVDLPFIKFAFPELKRLQSKNVFMDLYFYNALYFRNNTWTLNRGLELYLVFLERLLNHPNLKENGYTNNTIFIPINDWNFTSDNMIWNYRKGINPIACIYHLMYNNNTTRLKKIFGNKDIIFVSKNKYFKINFSTIDNTELKKLATKFKLFCIKLCNNEEFDLEDIDTSVENVDSKEVIQAKIVDKIEKSKGVDITKQVSIATDKMKSEEDIEKKIFNNKARQLTDNQKELINTRKNSMIAGTDPVITKQDKKTKDIIRKGLSNTKDESELDNNLEDEENNSNRDKDIEKLSDLIAKVVANSDTEEDAIDYLDTEEAKKILASLGTDDEVNISASRASRMNELSDKLLTKDVDGRSVKEILDDETSKEENTLDVNVASPNKEEWSKLGFVNFDKNYNIDKDIINIFRHFENCTRPIVIRDINVSDNSTSEDRVKLYDVDMEDYAGRRYKIKLDIPIMEDNRFLLRGNYKSIETQSFNMPIIKTDLGTTQLISNYKKIFLYRFGSTAGKSNTIVAKLVKAANKYKGRKIKFVSGYNDKVCSKYQLPIDYIDLAGIFTNIETDSWIVYFNQDEIREKYVVEEGKGFPFAFNKKLNAVEYFPQDCPHSFSKMLYLNIIKECPDFEELFNSASRPTVCSYVRASIMSSKIPVIVICGYHVGLTDTLKRAGIKYTIESKLTNEIRRNIDLDWIKFNNGYIVYENTYSASLLLNGLKECSTDMFDIGDIDNKSMYLEFLDNFGGRVKADGLDNFYELFVDPMIKESLEFYNLPTNYIDILLYGTALLADNKYIRHTDTSSRRLRRYQLIAVYTYQVLSKAYGEYMIANKHSKKNPEFSVKQSAVIDAFLTDTISSDDSCINALRDVETTNAVTTKGPSGMNSDRAYSLDKRAYDDSMLNVLGMSTGFAGNVGITRQTTINPNVTPEGYVKQQSENVTSEMNDSSSLTATEALIPFGSTRDDPMRTAMSFVQTAKHMVRTEDSDPLLVTNGSDEVMPYLTTDKFAFKAKKKGTVKEVTEDYIIVEYDDGTKDYINTKETIMKNSDGGYYVPLKLDPTDKIKVGYKFDANQILAYDKYSFSNKLGESDNIAYNIGKLAKIAILNTDEGFEDSGVISASMAKKLATRVDLKYDCVIDKDSKIFKFAKVGDHIEASDDLVMWQNAVDDEETEDLINSLLNRDNGDISDIGKRKLKSEVTGTIIDIKIFRTVELDELSPSIRKIVEEYEKPLKDMAKKLKENNVSISKIPAHYVLPATGKLKKAQNAIFIEFYVEYLDTVGVGDKIVYNAANKAVEKAIFPEGKEPYTAFRPNEPIDAFVAQTSISKRLVTSTLIYGSLQKLMIELDRSVKDIMGIDYDDSTV